jgi:hypothetical protein
MESIKDYAEVAYQKDLINMLLRQLFVGLTDQDYVEYTEMVCSKIHQQNGIRKSIRTDKGDYLESTATYYGVTTDAVLDAFMYFNLVVENIFLIKQLSKYVEKEE